MYPIEEKKCRQGREGGGGSARPMRDRSFFSLVRVFLFCVREKKVDPRGKKMMPNTPAPGRDRSTHNALCV